jgi:peroxiredoxin Q/BCP
MMIEPGEKAPAFALKDQSGKVRRLSEYRGSMVVMYFYPEDDTPLCTKQACQFRDVSGELKKLGAVVLGISPQDVESKQAFARKFDLSFAVLADDKVTAEGPAVSVAYGAWGEKNMYGRIVRSMRRTTYLIGADGKVIRRWDRVKTPGHGEKVLEAVREEVSRQRQ